MQRGSGYYQRVGAILKHQTDVHELVGVQSVVGVVEDGLQLGCAGGGVDLVIDRKQGAGGETSCVGAVPRLGHQLVAAPHLGEDLGKLVLWQGKDDGDGLYLGDDDQAGGAGCGDDVADVNLTQADDAVDGRGDACVVEADAGLLNGSTVCGQGADGLAGRCFLRLRLFF